MVIKGRNTYKYTALQKPNPALSQKGFVRRRGKYILLLSSRKTLNWQFGQLKGRIKTI